MPPPRRRVQNTPSRKPNNPSWGLRLGICSVVLSSLILAAHGCTGPTGEPAGSGLPEGEPVAAIQPQGPETPPSPTPPSGEKPDPKPLTTVARKPLIPSRYLAEPPAKPWRNALGSWGAVPPVTRRQPDQGITRLEAVVFPPGGQTLLLVGTREPDRPLLNTRHLLDAFVIAYRAIDRKAKNLGVTIEPSPQQKQRGLTDKDRMAVEYLGGTGDTAFGLASFRADYRLKPLAHGEEPETHKPIVCDVPGYESVLDRLAALPPGKVGASWHRYWISQKEDRVSPSKDGRTFHVETTLQVQTEDMRNNDKDSKAPPIKPNPAALGFVTHLTDHYREFALKYPELAEIEAYAQMVAVAGAIQDTTNVPAATSLARELKDLLDRHQPQQIDTPSTCAALVTVKGLEEANGDLRIIRKLQAEGGVDLLPVANRYQKEDPSVDSLQKDVLTAVAASPQEGVWTVTSGDRKYQVVEALPSSAQELRLWQVDLTSGPLEVKRVTPAFGPPGPGPDWSLLLPHLSVSKEMVKLVDQPSRPLSVTLQESSGKMLTLDRPMRVGIPGQGKVPGYGRSDDAASLACFKDRWLLVEGDVRYPALPGPGTAFLLERKARVMIFSPDDEPPRLQSMATARGITSYAYQDNRLAEITYREGRGDSLEAHLAREGLTAGNLGEPHRIRLLYDDRGRLAGLEEPGGQRINYRYGSGNRLRAVVNREGQAISYQYQKGDGQLRAIRADALPGEPSSTWLMGDVEVSMVAARSEMRAAGARLASDLNAQLVCIREQAGPDDPPLAIDGKGQQTINASYTEIQKHADLLQDAFETANVRNKSRQELEKILNPLVAANARLVVTGHHDRLFAQALTSLQLKHPVLEALDIDRARENLSTPPRRDKNSAELSVREHGVRRGNIYLHEPGLAPHLHKVLLDQLKQLPIPEDDGGVIVIVGDHSQGMQEAIHQLGKEGALTGKVVVLVMCGTEQSTPLATDIFTRYQARGVDHYADVMDQGLLPELLPLLHERLSADGEGSVHDRVGRALQTAPEQILQKAREGTFPTHIRLKPTGSDEKKREELEQKVDVLRRIQHRISKGPRHPGIPERLPG